MAQDTARATDAVRIERYNADGSPLGAADVVGVKRHSDPVPVEAAIRRYLDQLMEPRESRVVLTDEFVVSEAIHINKSVKE